MNESESDHSSHDSEDSTKHNQNLLTKEANPPIVSNILQPLPTQSSEDAKPYLEEEKAIVFEDINQEDAIAAEIGYDDPVPQQRKSIRDKLRQGAAVKSFIAQTLDKGLRAMHDLKDSAVTHLDAAAGNMMLFQDKNKKKRLSEDLTLQQMSGAKTDNQLIKSAENSNQ